MGECSTFVASKQFILLNAIFRPIAVTKQMSSRISSSRTENKKLGKVWRLHKSAYMQCPDFVSVCSFSRKSDESYFTSNNLEQIRDGDHSQNLSVIFGILENGQISL